MVDVFMANDFHVNNVCNAPTENRLSNFAFLIEGYLLPTGLGLYSSNAIVTPIYPFESGRMMLLLVC